MTALGATTEAQKHSPTPWSVQPFNGDDVHNLLICSTATKKSPAYLPVATMTGCHIDTPANAAHIVHCVNSFDALTEANKKLREALAALLPMIEEWHAEFPRDIGDKEAPAIAAARAALKVTP